MSSHAITLPFRISAQQYAEAVRQLRDGYLNASPLTLALAQQETYTLYDATEETITLMDIATGRLYSGSMPAALTKYLAVFHSGIRVLEDHEFELLLVSQGD